MKILGKSIEKRRNKKVCSRDILYRTVIFFALQLAVILSIYWDLGHKYYMLITNNDLPRRALKTPAALGRGN